MSSDGELILTIIAYYAQEESLPTSENRKYQITKTSNKEEQAILQYSGIAEMLTVFLR